MPQYIRAFAPGGTFFFTVNLLNRQRSLLTDHVDLLQAAFGEIRERKPFDMKAYVINPDHLHCVWQLPDGDADFSSRWQAIKAHFARHILAGESLSARRQKKGERGVWQRRFWEHVIRDEQDFERHVDYIHYNPVKHGHAQTAMEWPHSSFRRYVARSTYPANWAAGDEVARLELE